MHLPHILGRLGIRPAALMLAVAGVLLSAVLYTQARVPVQSSPVPSRSAQFPLPEPIKPAGSLEVVQKTTAEHYKGARSVVLAECVERRVDVGPGGNIFTFYKFAAEQVIKGSEPAVIELRVLGGTLDGVSISQPISKSFEPGKQYVLMLGPRASGNYRTLNPAAVYSVGVEPQSNRRIVVPGVNGLQLYDAATGSPLEPNPGWAFLDDFLVSLKRAL
jgi:hypothetical protein